MLRFVEAALGASGLDLENSVDCGKRTRGEPLVVQLVPAEDKSESDQKSESGNRRNACCSVRSHLGGDDDKEEDDVCHLVVAALLLDLANLTKLSENIVHTQ